MPRYPGSTWLKALCLLPLVPALLLPGVGVLASLIIVVAVLVFVKSSRAPTLAMRHRSIFLSVAVGLAFGLAATLAFGLLMEPVIERLAGSRIDLTALGGIEGDFGAYLMLLAVALLFGGVVEEVIFRGYVVGWGAALFGDRAAPWLCVLSATVFGISHLYQGPAGVVATGLIGLCFGLLYLWTGRRLLPVIVAHMTVNAVGVTALYLGVA